MKKLFIPEGFTPDEAKDLWACMNPITRKYLKNESIMRLSEENDDMGIVLSGEVFLTGTNMEGQTSIIDYYEKNDVFGRRLSPETELNAYYVVAKSKCEIIFVPYQKLISCCHKCCQKHTKLIDYLIKASVRRSQIHIDILMQRTTRGKLIYYFEYLSRKKDSAQFTLPFSLSDLADYLSVDRSAMMRELKKLNDEGFLISKNGKITLMKKNNDIIVQQNGR